MSSSAPFEGDFVPNPQPEPSKNPKPISLLEGSDDPYYIGPVEGRRLEVGNTNFWNQYVEPVAKCLRPGFNNTGREVELKLNAYPITRFPTLSVYQYDVTIGNNTEKRGVIKKVWNSKARTNNLKNMIFDGNKLAWSLNNYDDFSVMVNLDQEENRPLKELGTRVNKFRLAVRKVKPVNLACIEAWLNGRLSFDENVLQALNFLDHLLREGPSRRYICFKRSFYDEHMESEDLQEGVMCLKGYYQALRAALPGRLVVNVDIENTAFWSRITLSGQARSMVNARDYWEVGRRTQPKADGFTSTKEHDVLYDRLQGLEVQPHYPGCPVTRTFFVRGIVLADTDQFKLDIKDHATGKTEKMSMNQYFKKRYDIILDYPNLPVVEVNKKGVYYPMEHLVIMGLQRYPFKLSDDQTYRMLKIAVQRPEKRLESIMASKKALNHENDEFLKSYGLQIGNDMIRTKARVLPSPEIQFGNSKHNPGVTGRWDLRGKKFLKPNRVPLRSWGCGIMIYRRNQITVDQAKAWIDGFIRQYQSHGGLVEGRPLIMTLTEDIGSAVEDLYQATGKKYNSRPQLLLFFAPNKDSWPYLRIKKSCDCRWGVASQVLQTQQMIKMNTQYMSNVAMKVNAKLGGVTARAIPRTRDAALRPGSIIIGADVSHATPGSWAPSMSAIAVSADEFGAKYMGHRETGTRRVEMINSQNMKEMLVPMIAEWVKSVGKGRRPRYVYYFRDGVSTAQFSQVLEKEVPMIKEVIMQATSEKEEPKVCVVIANKRHHLRSFPRPSDKAAADRNGNPVPGTLIERDITSPHDWDFLLYPHIALQGTSRPVHYHVILDQIGHQPHQLQNMIYDHSYQYVRSTTSVSLFPAVYYAHLISNRARHHENVSAKEGPQSGPYIKLTDYKKKRPEYPADEPPRLLPMAKNPLLNHLDMWFV